LDDIWLAHEGTLLEMHEVTKSHNRPTYKLEMLWLGIKCAALGSDAT
jgi:hypothetical protein